MGCHLGPAFRTRRKDGTEKPFTGRHWWGEHRGADEVIEPLIGRAAEDVARKLGFPERPLGRTGTTIMILDPALGQDSPAEQVGRIAENMLHFFWPRLLRDTPRAKAIKFRLELDGVQIPVPSPEDFPPLDLFAAAIRKVRAAEETSRAVVSRRPAKHLGRLAIEKGLVGRRTPLVEGESVFPRQSSHIAVMRPVELVVRYYEGEPFPDERVEWAGVFVADEDHEVERAFAEAEPPAHDDWVSEFLEKGSRARTFVNVAVRQIKDAAATVVSGGRAASLPTGSGPSLAEVSSRLGVLLGGGVIPGDPFGRRASGRNRGARKRTVTAPSFLRLENGARGPVAVFRIDVGAGPAGTILQLNPVLAMEGSGLTPEKGDNDTSCEVVRVTDSSGTVVSTSGILKLPSTSSELDVFVEMPPDCGVALLADLLPEGSQ